MTRHARARRFNVWCGDLAGAPCQCAEPLSYTHFGQAYLAQKTELHEDHFLENCFLQFLKNRSPFLGNRWTIKTWSSVTTMHFGRTLEHSKITSSENSVARYISFWEKLLFFSFVSICLCFWKNNLEQQHRLLVKSCSRGNTETIRTADDIVEWLISFCRKLTFFSFSSTDRCF